MNRERVEHPVLDKYQKERSPGTKKELGTATRTKAGGQNEDEGGGKNGKDRVTEKKKGRKSKEGN